jgi:hypothetical protein
MSDAMAIALISTAGAVLIALIGVLVELVRNRRKTERVVNEMAPNHGSSMRDAIDRLENGNIWIGRTVAEHGERLAAIEAHIGNRPARRRSWFGVNGNE